MKTYTEKFTGKKVELQYTGESEHINGEWVFIHKDALNRKWTGFNGYTVSKFYFD